MSLTLASVTKELSALPADADMEAIAGAITHGSLMGARGNSGVITSQILRGVAEGLVSADDPITSANIAFAFRRAVKVAFQAVRKPIEGTILTVLRDVSTKADECEKKKFSAEDALDAIVVEAYQSVARTPDLLPVLKENGVVDSAPLALPSSLRTSWPQHLAAAPLSRISPPRLIPLALPATRPSVALRSRPTTIGRARSSATATSSSLRPTLRLTRTSALSSWAPWATVSCSWAPTPTTRSTCTSNTPNLVLEHMLQLGQIYEVFIHNMEMEAHDRTAKIHEDQEKAAEPAKHWFCRRCRWFR